MKQNSMTLTQLRERFKTEEPVQEHLIKGLGIDYAKIVTYDRILWEDFVFEEGFVFDYSQSGLAVFWMADDLYLFPLYRNADGNPNEKVGFYESPYPFNERVRSYIKMETEMKQMNGDTEEKEMPNSKEVMELIFKMKY